MYYFGLFAGALAVSFVAVPGILFISSKLGLYDCPKDPRKIHQRKISRLGGVAMFLGFIVPLILYVDLQGLNGFSHSWYYAGMVVAFGTGFIDDLRNIPARYKLLLQLVAGACVAASGMGITELKIPGMFHLEFGIFSYLFTVLWVVGFINAINLVDGMDGLASGIVFIANAFIGVMAFSLGNTTVAVITLLMAGAILGFYLWNFPPAKIFMGDGGAYFLGFMYATVPLMGIKKTAVLTLFLFPLILLLVPLVDILQVMHKRIKLGYHIFTADKNHIHHRLMNLGFSQRGILLVMYGYTVILGLLGLLLTWVKPELSLLLFILVSIIVSLSFYMLYSAEKITERQQEKVNEYKRKLEKVEIEAVESSDHISSV